ncbi:hypothetical protein PMNALOAF_2650 [Methylobacterium adhaesivum]|uniref:Serine/threonine protein kinase n=1 Tax=Methylobacterium adhaesivum TaxID=333297 RepID=A0ABT8BH09_9HYPH|nr:hypothetical protein [Methylobacterium adhaesivum]MDN3590571.1 hypothetical protein [Methylobacterium adhaesivum]GJD31393.1 hypothetical protein PMNALOAF_2650 [Methylobacterium adhaesivum]
MRLTPLLIVSALLTGPALAQAPSGNVAQPERAVPQAGNTTGGPLENPASRDMAPARSGSMPAGENGVSSSTGAVDSAKGGNAQQNERAVPNTGGTSGGPAR